MIKKIGSESLKNEIEKISCVYITGHNNGKHNTNTQYTYIYTFGIRRTVKLTALNFTVYFYIAQQKTPLFCEGANLGIFVNQV